MGTHALREGFREVLRDPALLLIEIGWRWSFGVIAILVFAASVFLVLGSISLDPQRLQSLSRLRAWEAAQVIANTVVVIGRHVLRVGICAVLFLALFWTCLSAWGRYATLTRPAFAHKADLRSCFAISAARAAVSVGAIAAWIGAAFLAGLVGSATATDVLPNVSLMLAILLLAFILLVSAWSWMNWYLSLAVLFSKEDWRRSLYRVWNFLRLHSDRILEISIVSGVMRGVVFLATLMLSLAAAAVITNPRVLVADLIAISLLYFLVADFIYLARLAAYARVATQVAAQSTFAVDGRQTESVDASSVRGAQDSEPAPAMPPPSLLDQI